MKKNTKYQVFVSSTFEDLKDERKEITQAILESNCIPVGMEMFPATNKTQWEFIKSVIDESDVYLVIIAGRYGSEGEDENGKKVSYTEMEFDYALKMGKPIIALLHEDISLLPKVKCETSLRKNKKLNTFVQKVKNGRMIKKWSNKDNIKSAALTALTAVKELEECKTSGWVSYRFATEYEELLVENKKNLQRVELVERQLSEMKNKEKESIYEYRKLRQDNERLGKIIYNGYFDSNYLRNNDEVDEIIENIEMSIAIQHQHL